MEKKAARFGSVSHATMRREDLIPCFLDELEELIDEDVDGASVELIREIRCRLDKSDYYESDDASDDLDELFGQLDLYAPRYGYFGASEDDGSDYGFWPIDVRDIRERILESDGLVVDDLGKVPNDHRGEVLEVNDHGNVTLYDCVPVDGNSRLTEVWSLV